MSNCGKLNCLSRRTLESVLPEHSSDIFPDDGIISRLKEQCPRTLICQSGTSCNQVSRMSKMSYQHLKIHLISPFALPTTLPALRIATEGIISTIYNHQVRQYSIWWCSRFGFQPGRTVYFHQAVQNPVAEKSFESQRRRFIHQSLRFDCVKDRAYVNEHQFGVWGFVHQVGQNGVQCQVYCVICGPIWTVSKLDRVQCRWNVRLATSLHQMLTSLHGRKRQCCWRWAFITVTIVLPHWWWWLAWNFREQWTTAVGYCRCWLPPPSEGLHRPSAPDEICYLDNLPSEGSTWIVSSSLQPRLCEVPVLQGKILLMINDENPIIRFLEL